MLNPNHESKSYSHSQLKPNYESKYLNTNLPNSRYESDSTITARFKHGKFYRDNKLDNKLKKNTKFLQSQPADMLESSVGLPSIPCKSTS